MTTTQRFTNATGSRVPMDYQRIVADLRGVAFVSDQGLFIQPADDSVELTGACGNMSTNIAISPSISGDGTNRWTVTTAWDWGRCRGTRAHWPGWNCPIAKGRATRTAASARRLAAPARRTTSSWFTTRTSSTRRPAARTHARGRPLDAVADLHDQARLAHRARRRVFVKMAVAPPTAAEAAALAAATFDDDDEGDDNADDELVEAGEGACDAAASRPTSATLSARA